LERDFPGLQIITADSYASMKQQEPLFPYKDWGDFYSEVQKDDLADRIYQTLQEKDISDNTSILTARSFNERTFDETKNYIIKETTGVRIYVPKAYQEEYSPLGAELTCFFMSTIFVEGILYSEKEGEFQKQHKESIKGIQTAIREGIREGLKPLTELRDEVERLSDRAHQLAEKLRKKKRGKIS